MIIRHDVEANRYLAQSSEFPAVVAVDSFQEQELVVYDKIDELLKPSLIPAARLEPKFYTRYDGMGSLIQPDWVLSAAHVATELSLDKKITFKETDYSIQQIVLHPDFCNYGLSDDMAQHDIALIQLNQPAEGIPLLPLYRETNELEKIATFVGRGDFGTGLIGPDRVDGKLRKATNQVDEVDEQWLIFKFDAPPGGTELEGISGPGDSGGPALLDTGEGWAIAGISSGQKSEGFGEGHYGVREYYTRVSKYVDWIESVTALETA